MVSPLTVIKVGGSLLRSAADFRTAAAAIAERRRSGRQLLVVVSALEGVTNALQRAALTALDARRRNLGEVTDRLRHRHEEIAQAIAGNGGALGRIQGALDTTEKLLVSVRAAGELSDSTHARLLSSGERLSVHLLAAAIRTAGVSARAITSEELGLKASGSPQAGVCDLAGSSAGLRKARLEMQDRVLVLTGFYGVDRGGGVVLFGRGGSDDTAGAVAAGSRAEALELWKDVPGFMSADPRHVDRARIVSELSFDEVAQLGRYGSYIVHHGCLEPLRGGFTEIRITSLNSSNGNGTHVVENRQSTHGTVMALAGQRARAVMRVPLPAKRRGLVSEIAAQLSRTEIPLDWFTVSSSELCFKLAEPGTEKIERALRGLVGRQLEVHRFPSLIGAVGDGVASNGAVTSGMRSCLSGYRVDGGPRVRRSGPAGLSCSSIHQEDLVPALNSLHRRFFDPGS